MSVPVVRFKILLVVCAIFLVAWIGWIEFISGRGIFSYSHHSSARFAVADPASHSNSFKKPTGFKIIGLVFYGRKQTVSILDCYLKRNLVENGGFLDEVLFVSRTENPRDLAYLEELLKTSSRYTSVNLNEGRTSDYSKPFEILEDGPMYIKIDDDVVYIEDSAIPSMVTSLVEHPEYFLVSANIINQPAFSWVHWHLGVVHPYLPELTPPPGYTGRRNGTWRASELPDWSGPTDRDFTQNFAAPFDGHRWLPLKKGIPDDQTPISTTQYNLASRGWSRWEVAAQQHYSFFQNLEQNQLDNYHIGMWDFKYDRISVHMLAIWGADVRANLPFPADDEGYLTQVLPKMLKRHAIVDGRGIAAHYSFDAQMGSEMGADGHGMEWTDVIDRYRAYAEEMKCRR